MSNFAPPPGPPPPKAPEVPEGWLAQWNEQYKEWFYVNLNTKQSQWEKPTAPALPAGPPPPPQQDDAPPGYSQGDAPTPSDTKNNPYLNMAAQGGGGSSSKAQQEEEDARLARELQEQERSRQGQTPLSQPSPGPFLQNPGPHQAGPYQQAYPPAADASRGKGKSGGLLGKLMDKAKASSSSRPGGSHQGYGHAPPPQGYGGYPPQQGYMGGGYPQQGYGPQGGYGAPPAGYGGYPQQAHYGGYPQQQQGRKKPGMGGAGMMGGAALGVGAGLIGGALIADAVHDGQEEAYQEGYQDGQDNDFGGGDDFGGDFGGDF
ncbi:uncharacterized protein DNG_06506 [Cephalotrichum gorgonifer]|uniref:WW domain-containing protein n=1 Tax=Cephalotrichum gorgonifer TaxID=2041049 RepID=A0AAE8SWM3_9PEZI|nr:uncharacterized protein DNG_06506 [Cephalotrichum gorgonifer]